MHTLVDHYAISNLKTRLTKALRAAGADPARPSLSVLATLDQLHTGEFGATEAQVEFAEIPRRAVVLDAGCGIGGASRYLVAEREARVEAIDLTPAYVETARWLNAAVGFADRIRVREGSVTALPYKDASFDAVIAQNVSMNVRDKPAMFAEAHRVLKPGGVLTFTHIAATGAGDPYYPLPWARLPKHCFYETREGVLSAVVAAGFTRVADRIDEAKARAAERPEVPCDFVPAMGDDMPERLANSARSKNEGRLVDMMVFARRPG